ncbi:unnamed protein product, partial [Meganyctiphanes norvegica]
MGTGEMGSRENHVEMGNGNVVHHDDKASSNGAAFGIKEDHINKEEDGFDKALEAAGSWGPWQHRFFVIAAFSQVFTAMHSVAAVFLSAVPKHWCQVPELHHPNISLSHEEIKNISIPWINAKYSSCDYLNHNYSALASHVRNVDSGLGFNLNSFMEDDEINTHMSDQTLNCQNWIFDTSEFQSTVVSEWSLVCVQRYLGTSVQASYMGGLLVGSLIMGQISDKYGRRKTTMISVSVSMLCAILASIVPAFEAFLALRFIVAAMGAGMMVTNFVLVMELVEPDARSSTGMWYAIPYGLGISTVSMLSYFIRSWRFLQLTLGCTSAILLLYYWLLPESPRWLMSKGRPNEALDVLKRVASGNKRKLPKDEEMLNYLRLGKLKENYFRRRCLKGRSFLPHRPDTKETPSEGSGFLGMLRSQLSLVRTPIMRRRCLISFFIWFVGSTTYYGLTFSGGNIKANLFLMVFISGVVEVPACIISPWMLRRIGRRATMCILFIGSGSACLLILAVPVERVMINLILANVGKFFISAAFQMSYIYTSELTPTGVRNIAVGTSSMWARVGTILSPFIVDFL